MEGGHADHDRGKGAGCRGDVGHVAARQQKQRQRQKQKSKQKRPGAQPPQFMVIFVAITLPLGSIQPFHSALSPTAGAVLPWW